MTKRKATPSTNTVAQEALDLVIETIRTNTKADIVGLLGTIKSKRAAIRDLEQKVVLLHEEITAVQEQIQEATQRVDEEIIEYTKSVK